MDKRYQFDRYEDYSHDSLRYTSMEESGNEVLIMTIDIGDGRKDDLLVREDDDPRILAENFCKKHSLGQDIKKALIDQIEQNLEIHADDDNSTLLSVNKSYESKPKKNEIDSIRSSLGLGTENHLNNKRSATPLVQDKKKKIEEVRESRRDFVSKSPSIDNYGQKMYLKGIRFIENVNRKKEDILKKKNEKEMQDTTFRPKINSKNTDRAKVQEILLKKGKERQENIERKRGEKLAVELSACTFSPLINKKSEKNIKNLETSASRFVKLYENAKSTQNKIKLINDK
jgi:hypothetical protein